MRAGDIGFEVLKMFLTGTKEVSRKKKLEKLFWKAFLNEKQFIDRCSTSIWCVMGVSNKKSQAEIEKVLKKSLSYSN